MRNLEGLKGCRKNVKHALYFHIYSYLLIILVDIQLSVIQMQMDLNPSLRSSIDFGALVLDLCTHCLSTGKVEK